ncbi:hypothetical protein KUTeg_009206 [Tegillarca granosa]|uniref:Phage protein n=1 Tax=Tegillarca granosa TaxID=220873 RepID=A0ABQ9F7E0_TEGGR|nr:hypothetical protein KUTeg_015380 [Tegillarca granosa]KAJ8313244.1 hypothetical protein KUTeg_009206 [Tegillarca granosa]
MIKFPVNPNDFEAFRDFCEYPSTNGCAEGLKEHFDMMLHEGGRNRPINAEDAKDALKWLLQQIIISIHNKHES